MDLLGLEKRYSLQQKDHESPPLENLSKAQTKILSEMVEHSHYGPAINEMQTNMRTSIVVLDDSHQEHIQGKINNLAKGLLTMREKLGRLKGPILK